MKVVYWRRMIDKRASKCNVIGANARVLSTLPEQVCMMTMDRMEEEEEGKDGTS